MPKIAAGRLIPTIVGGTSYGPIVRWQKQSVRRDRVADEDPIFVAIENHRMAYAEKLECYAEADRLTKLGALGPDDFEPYTDGPYNETWNAWRILRKQFRRGYPA